MNFRKLLKYLAFGTAAVIPFATAQNPTILQGSYISNVFGQSNFIKNPNAQTNLVNVTTVTATVVRSTTTPLVATSEFTVAIGTANGTATWSTRTFDVGMKNNNCEARFSYRGFAATSKVDIKQGANTVASLNLTPATDPRIASINFPCGDLSVATTFVVTDTSTLAGTNEIGGIYVGLATNMANVAQAEFVGAVKWATAASCMWTIGGNVTSYGNFAADADCTTPTSGNIEGQASAPSTKVPGITFSNLKPGRYIFTATGLIQNGGGSNTALGITYYAYFRFHDGTNAAKNENATFMTRTTGNDGPGVPVITGEFEYSAAQSNVTIQIQGKTNSVSPNAAFAVVDSTTQPLYISVYRFPSASELVVTPERQNWYVSASHAGANPNLGLVTVSTKSEIFDAGLTLTPDTASQPVATLCSATNAPPSLSTSATTCAAGSESLGITFNIPSTGAYEVCAQFSSNTVANAGGTFDLAFSIEETAINANTAITNNKANARFADAPSTLLNTAMPFQQCNNILFSSIGQKAARLMFQQTVNPTVLSNIILADNARGRAVAWTVKPLGNQSNSALYVQGPVLGAQTGAAIPAGYLGKNEFGGGTAVADPLLGAQTTNVYTISNVTPGVYLARMYGAGDRTGAQTATFGFWSCLLTTNAALSMNWYNYISEPNIRIGASVGAYAGTHLASYAANSQLISVTSTNTYYVRCATESNNSGISLRAGAEFIRLN